MDGRTRCRWCNGKNENYVRYHDKEWGTPCHDDYVLYEMLILESFQAGLSWETILNKRDHFRDAFDHFDIQKVSQYSEEKMEELRQNAGIVRNRLKIRAAVNNSKIAEELQKEFGSLDTYFWNFTDRKTIYEKPEVTTNWLSDRISEDLKKRGMTFVGSTIIYSFLQAIGIIDSHEETCWRYSGK